MADSPVGSRPRRSLLKSQAYQEIKDRIQDSTFAGGSFLSERQLAALLGMSKTPIKAALERLEQEGFVTVSPQQGIVVREITVQEIADQFELRRVLEEYVVRQIAGKLTTAQLSTLERNLRHQQNAVEKSSVKRITRLDTEFHVVLCQSLGNEAILESLMQHRSRMHRVIHQVMVAAPGRLATAYEEHLGIFEAIRDGKPDLAARRLNQHLDFGERFMLSNRGR